MVAVSESALALIGLHQLAKLYSVDSATGLGQITGLIVAPQLAIGQCCDGLGELAPCGATRASTDSAPVQRERPAVCVAFGAHNAISRAAILFGSAYGNWACLNIGRFECEMDLHFLPFTVVDYQTLACLDTRAFSGLARSYSISRAANVTLETIGVKLWAPNVADCRYWRFHADLQWRSYIVGYIVIKNISSYIPFTFHNVKSYNMG